MKFLKAFLILGIGTLVLMIVGFYNGYPLVSSDTGTYLYSGYDRFIPVDRAISYGLFVRFFCMDFSLWLVVLVQNFITAYVIYEILKVLKIKKKRFHFIYFSALTFLMLFTGIAWYSNQIMPDFFAPITILIIYILLKGENLTWVAKIALAVILIYSMIAHFSHMMIGSVLMLIVLIFHFVIKKYFDGISFRKILEVSAIVFSVWIILPTINYMAEKKFILSKGSHVFLMSHLVDTGILEKFLNENCSKEEFKDCKLCNYKDSLPTTLPDFFWTGNILENTGGYLNSQEEYNKIITATLIQPKYLFLNIWQSVSYGLIQLTKNNIGDGLSAYNKGSAPYGQVYWRFRGELNNYSNSRQNYWGGVYRKFDALNTVSFFVLLISLFIVIWLFTTKILSKLDNAAISFLIFILVSIVLNSFVTAGLNSPNDRFQARVVWMLPLAIIIVFAKNNRILFKTFFNKISGKHKE